jgi:UDP-N-acetylmuramoylalanine--D-glutamate ligase
MFAPMKITVIGAARSGMAAAALAASEGHHVLVSENGEQRTENVPQHEGVEFEWGGHTDRALDADLIVTSPGVPPTNIIRQRAAERGIPVISELEFAWKRLRGNKVVAVTGTNGKTTTTSMIAWILQQSGRKAVACGNIGTPLSSLVRDLDSTTVVVVEVSSYQLDCTIDFRPDVSVLMNITPDHLSYHGTFERYVEAKWKIFVNQRESDVVILNADDPHAAAGASRAHGIVEYVSVRTKQQGAYLTDGEIILCVPPQHKEETLMPARRLGVPGTHNLYNSMAAALAARALEVRNEDIRDSLASFSGVEHRLEFVREFHGARWYNDSKATNVNAAWYALSSFDHPIVWIAGGRGDNNDYSELDELVDTNVHAIVCIGEEADAIFNHWCTSKRCVKARTLGEAVKKAAELAELEDIVLFSPACKSFDMFSNFEQRGTAFKEFVVSM